MNKGTKFNLSSDANGSISISNEETNITIHPDGTVAISTTAPLQLTGASLAKLDRLNLAVPYELITHALCQRLVKK